MQDGEPIIVAKSGLDAPPPSSPQAESGNGSPRSNGDGAASTVEMYDLLHALQAMQHGDFSVRLHGTEVGIMGKIADTFNEIVAANQRMARQLERVGQVVGREGKTRQRVRFGLSSGAWGEMETSVNTLIDDLLWPTTEVTRAIAAVAQGDLLRTVPLDVDGRPLQGEFLRSATIVNTMIKQLSVFTSEVTRVTSAANERSWSTMVLMASLSCRISPRTSTVIFFDKSPLATAMVTSAMFRTWAVRLDAIEFTDSVKSFHTPATPTTFA